MEDKWIFYLTLGLALFILSAAQRPAPQGNFFHQVDVKVARNAGGKVYFLRDPHAKNAILPAALKDGI